MSSFETSPISGSLTLRLTPRGHLLLVPDADVSAPAADIQQQLVDAFAVGGGSGLFYLGSTQVGTVLPPLQADRFAFFRTRQLVRGWQILVSGGRQTGSLR